MHINPNLEHDPYYHDLANNLYHAYFLARQNKRHTSDENKFELHLADNINFLARDITLRRYHPSRGIAFITHKPVIREIFAAPFRDRVVHHLIFSYVADWWDRRFIYDSYSCRNNKGNDFAIQRLYHFMRKVSHNFQCKTYVIKLDIQGYFMSLPRRRLYERAMWGINQQFPPNSYEHNLLSYLWSEIIFDDPTRGVTRRGSQRSWELLPKSKSLFCQPPGQGIVIGNLTSQLLSNIYLDQLDQFITHHLNIKTYGRYVDDFFFVISAKELPHFLKNTIPQIEAYITGLGLTLHPRKRFCQPLERGIPFLGVKLYPYRILPDHRITNNFRQACHNFASGHSGTDLDSIISFLGRLQHMDSQRMIAKIFNEVGWDYQFDNLLGPNSLYYTNPKLYKKRKFWS